MIIDEHDNDYGPPDESKYEEEGKDQFDHLHPYHEPEDPASKPDHNPYRDHQVGRVGEPYRNRAQEPEHEYGESAVVQAGRDQQQEPDEISEPGELSTVAREERGREGAPLDPRATAVPDALTPGSEGGPQHMTRTVDAPGSGIDQSPEELASENVPQELKDKLNAEFESDENVAEFIIGIVSKKS